MIIALLFLSLLLIIGVPLTLIGAKIVEKHFEPEPGSNEALRNWLLSNPDKTIDDYLEGR